MALMTVLENGRWHYEMGGWAPPWGIEYVIDPLSGGMAVLVSFMALLACVYLDGQRQEQPQGGATLFDSLFLLLLAGLLGIILEVTLQLKKVSCAYVDSSSIIVSNIKEMK